MDLNNVNFDWIKDFPREWEMKRVKHLFKYSKDSTDNPDDFPVLSLTMRGVVERDVSNNEGQVPDSYNGYSLLKLQDIVLNPMDLISGWVDSTETEGLISPSYKILRPTTEDIDERFYKYYFQRCYKEKIFFHFGEGIHYQYRWGLGSKTLMDFPVLKPPLSEQKKIITFLDEKTKGIDFLISQKEKKIKLLKENNKSLIHKIFTKGLDERVELKESGVVWFGKIPKHWIVSKVSYELEFHNNRRVPLSTEERETRGGDYRYYGSTGVIDYVDDFIYDGEYILTGEDGFNIILRSQPLSRLVKGKFWVNNHSHIMKSKKSLNEFILQLLEITDYTSYRSGSRQPKLTIDNLKSVPLIIPPISEQEIIVKYMDEFNKKSNSVIKYEQEKINLLIEYKNSLISNITTGTVRV